jgi:Uncharacterized conserved protein
MVYVGVDGCPSGWFAVISGEGPPTANQYSSIDELWEANKQASRILIDIPIGLPSTDRRTCDIKAKQQLGCRGSSVFYTPSRSVLNVSSHEEMNRVNKRETSHGVSAQTHALMPKIKEVDEFLRRRPDAGKVLVESHPELCFSVYNDNTPVVYKKSSDQGRRKRIKILSQLYDNFAAVHAQFRDDHYVKDVGHDDIIDAMVLAAAAAGETATLPAEPEVDAEGRPMQMVYPVLA